MIVSILGFIKNRQFVKNLLQVAFVSETKPDHSICLLHRPVIVTCYHPFVSEMVAGGGQQTLATSISVEVELLERNTYYPRNISLVAKNLARSSEPIRKQLRIKILYN
jgi:hypothetical protein